MGHGVTKGDPFPSLVCNVEPAVCVYDVALGDANPDCNEATDHCYHTKFNSLDMAAARAFCDNLGQSVNMKMTLPVIENNHPRLMMNDYLAMRNLQACWLDAETAAPQTGDDKWKWSDGSSLDASCAYYMNFTQLSGRSAGTVPALESWSTTRGGGGGGFREALPRGPRGPKEAPPLAS